MTQITTSKKWTMALGIPKLTPYSDDRYFRTFSYDALGRFTGGTNSLGQFTFGHKGNTGMRALTTFPSGMSTSYSYFGAADDFRLSEIHHQKTSNSNTISKFNYSYTPTGMIDEWTRKLGHSTAAVTWKVAYDKIFQVTGVNAYDSAGAISKRWSYAYDDSGNRTSKTVDDQWENYETNNLNQVTAGGEEGETLFMGKLDEPATVTIDGEDAAVEAVENPVTAQDEYFFRRSVDLAAGSNSVSVVATDASNNTTTQAFTVTVNNGDTVTLAYDDNGNLTQKVIDPGGAGEETWSYGWDGINRLIWVLEGDAGSLANGMERKVLTYDGYDPPGEMGGADV